MRLIDANKLLKNGIRVSYGFDNDGMLLIPMADIVKSIKQAPTIDAVPVIRCEKCVLHGNCVTEDAFVLAGIENSFCCVGKRKEGAD